MSKKYIVEVGFHNAKIGRKVKGDIVENSPMAEKLWTDGYLKEYKTKVVENKPKKLAEPKEEVDSPAKTKVEKTKSKTKSKK